MNGERTNSIMPANNNNDLMPILVILGIISFVFFLLVGGSVLFYKSFGLDKLNLTSDLERDIDSDTSLKTEYDPLDEYSYEDYLKDNNFEVSDYEQDPEDIPSNQYDYAPPEDFTYEPDPYCYTYDHDLLPSESEQCMEWDLYLDVTEALVDYDSAVFRKESAESTMDFTCGSDSEIFKKSCADAKDRKEEAAEEIEYYSSIVNSLIN